MRDRGDGPLGFTDTRGGKGWTDPTISLEEGGLVGSMTLCSRLMSQLPVEHTEPGCTSKRDASAKVVLESCLP